MVLMSKKIIQTDGAPQAIGCYSQAVSVGNLVFLSGQIGLTKYGDFINDTVDDQLRQIFKNIKAVCNAANADLSDIVKLTVYLISMDDFDSVNQIMAEFFEEPYPARAAVAVLELPKGALVEVDAIVSLS